MPKPREGRPVLNRNPALKQLYYVWGAMISRCHKTTDKAYPQYGGRGIQVCDRWRGDFWAFFDDMGHRPAFARVLDRIDNDKGYEPSNCRWASYQVSNANRRWAIKIDGKTLKEYMRDSGRIDEYRMVTKRIAKGMPLAEALTKPARVWS